MSATSVKPQDRLDPARLNSPIGIDQPAGWWPTPPRLKSYEAAGFSHVQVRMPPRSLLGDRESLSTHARGLRQTLDLTSLELVLHAPDDLLAGTAEHDRQLDGALVYAAIAGARTVVYHGARVPVDGPATAARLRDEECSLRRVLRRAKRLGVRLAIENLAPVYPGPEYVSHDPLAVEGLVRRLGSEHAGVCLDIGHANIVAGLVGCELAELIEPVLDRVILFHVHDNYGPRDGRSSAPGVEPVRLDLHLPPGAGTVPWRRLSSLIATHPAPRQLEIHPARRPEPGTLAILTREVLRRA